MEQWTEGTFRATVRGSAQEFIVADKERDIINIDRHRVWIEEPGTLVCHIDGDVTGDNLRKMREMLDFIGEGKGPIIIMQDLSKAGAFTAAARKGIMDDKRTLRVKTVICIGASFQMRVFMSMITKALKFVYPEASLVLFAKDETEGREILARERIRLQIAS